MELPKSHKSSLQRPLDLNEFIKHPLQKSEDVITSDNQGQQISPKLQARIETISPKGLNKRSTEKPVPKVMKESQIPAPLQLRKKSSQLPGEVPNKLKITERKKDHGRTDGALLKERNARSLNSANSPRKNVKPLSLLNKEQKLKLAGKIDQGHSQENSFNGLKPISKEFSLARLEKLESEKREKIDKENRQKQLRHDLAYLDQLFPNELSDLEQKASRSTTAREIDESQEYNNNRGSEVANNPLETLISSPEEQKKVPTPTSEESSSIQESVTIKSSNSSSNSWISTIGQQGPASPAERLGQTARLDSSEFITPFLTMAAFVYFCYVLYI